ncbi:Malonyl CoA-acyl carrier protein transacylase [Minicystis rosea]|nr:Malonyl CoA-acyl carrier protein transacylase [Minicystis rosea]
MIHEAAEVPIVRRAIEGERALRDAIGEETRRPFDLAAGPVMRATLFSLGPEEHVLLVVMHHIACDGWSIGVIAREVSRLYAAHARGEASPLAELPIQVRDHAAWQRSYLSGAVLDAELAYWTERLAGAARMIELPTDRPRPPVPSRRGALRRFSLDAAATAALRDLARREGMTLFMVLLAAFDVLLHRWSGQRDIVVGTPIAGRTRTEIEGLVGCFVNTLVMRAEIAEGMSFRELLHRVREDAIGAHAHQDLPFERLVQAIEPDRDPSRSPIFQVMFVLQTALGDGTESAGGGLEIESGTAKFDLTLTLADREGGLSGGMELATDLFDVETIDRMLAGYRTLLMGLGAGVDRAVSELPILSDEEEARLIAAAGGSQSFTTHASLHAWFASMAARCPEAVAVTCEGQSLTYRALDEQSNQVARALRRRGVGREVLVGLCMDRTLAMVVGMLGILKAGGAYLPLDPEVPRERLAFMLEDAEVALVVTEARHASLITTTTAVLCLDVDAEEIGRESVDALAAASSPEDLAYVIYTSGSTGKPKGALVTHGNVVRLFAATEGWYGFGASDVWTMFHSYAFDFSVWEIWGALLYGGRLVIVPYWVSRFAESFHALLVSERVTVLNQTPSAFRQLMHADANADEAARDSLALRYVIFGGEALDVGALRPWWELHGDVSPQLVNMYGITETTVHVTYRPLCRADLERSWSSVIGVPIPDLSVHVLDERGRPVPVGVVGELHVGGAGVARGYLRRPELTAARFLEDPYRGEGRLYKTGDLGRRLGNGDIEYLGRIDHQVKIRGFRIELGEIESALSEHKSVREVVVLSLDDGAGDKRLSAYVVFSGAPVSAGELRAFLKERLPEYMVPSAYLALPSLPLTSNGKIDRRALPAPESLGLEERAYVAARGPVEEAIASVFAEVLRVPRVGAHDGFFELGGHSLSATRVVARLRAVLGVELPLRAIFEAPAPAELAARVAVELGAESDAAPPIVRVPRGGPMPASFGQERLWVLHRIEPDDLSYVVPFTLRFTGSVDVDALERSVRELCRRHEVLRTTFADEDGRPVQVIHHEDTDIRLSTNDLRGLPIEGRAEALRAALAEEGSRPFDLARGPVLRARLFVLGDEDHVLALTVHHIAVDAWSQGVITREIEALHAAFREGRPSPLAELSVQYADYAAWQRRCFSGEVEARQLAYWRAELGDAARVIELPTDKPRPAIASHRGARFAFTLPVPLSRAVSELSRREGATLFMTLLAAFAALLQRYTGQEDVVIGTPVANRSRAETEGLVGFFLSTLLIRARPKARGSFRELLRDVRERCLGAYAHQDAPFERLVQELDPERDLSRSPLFQVLFTFHAAPSVEARGGGLSVRAGMAETTAAKVDLALAMGETESGALAGGIEYATDLFVEATVARVALHLTTLLAGVIAAPDARLCDIDILPPEERRLLVEGWNDTRAAYARAACVHELVTAQAERTPDVVAVSIEGRDGITYGELVRRARKLARHLRGRGVAPGALVGIAVERSPAMVIGLLGILLAGATYVPMDPSYPRDRLRLVATDAGLAAMVTEEAFAEALPAPAGGVVRLDADAARIEEESEAPFDAGVSPESLAYVIYTSGSTGTPKGVAVPHRAVVNFLASMAREPGLVVSDRLLAVTSLSFDIAGLELWLPLVTGAYVEIARRETAADGAALAARIEAGDITVIQATPTTFRLLVEAGWRGDGKIDVLVGGEAVPRDLADQLIDRAGSVWNMYGPTETTIWSCVARLAKGTPVLVGRPIANTQVYVLDDEGGLLPIGVPGELYIGGDGVACGYLHRAALTEERFVPDPFSSREGARLYRTGDRARWRAEGSIEILGRLDFQVKIRGHRIELGEVEAAIGACPAVREAVVVAREDGGGKRLVAYVVPHEAMPTAAELGSFVRERLPEYMVPAAFVRMGRLPLTPNGKIDRRALPAPDDGDRAESGAVYAAPETEVERTLARIWAALLRVPRVGRHDNFFALGGDSILGIQVVTRAGAEGIRIAPRLIFQHPTIAALGAAASAGVLEGDEPALPAFEDAGLSKDAIDMLSALDPNAGASE